MKKKYDLTNATKAKKRKDLKVQKSFRIDPDVLLWLEEQGEKNGMGYQTFLNWYLKRQMTEEQTLAERLSSLEAEVFKKKRAWGNLF